MRLPIPFGSPEDGLDSRWNYTMCPPRRISTFEPSFFFGSDISWVQTGYGTRNNGPGCLCASYNPLGSDRERFRVGLTHPRGIPARFVALHFSGEDR